MVMNTKEDGALEVSFFNSYKQGNFI